MTPSWKTYLILTIICLAIQGFFCMFEIACVSFNKVRLQYYVSQNRQRAKWLSYLINRPALLFGVTLLGVNAALQVGSECSRRFYDAVGLNPDLAPVSQILLVIIFAELAPMFAGRRCPEHVAMLGIPIVYVASILIRPLIWFLDLLCQAINRLTHSPLKEGIFLTREELQHLFEKRETTRPSREINTLATNIFSLRNKTAKDLMLPLQPYQEVSSFCSVPELRHFLLSHPLPYIPVYQRTPQNVIGIVYPRDLLRIPEEKSVKDCMRAAWFISEKSPILQILKQFRRNNQSLAVVLNENGLAVGILTLDEIVDAVFGRSDDWESFGEMAPRMHHVIVDRSFTGDMEISQFNQKFLVHLDSKGANTLEELMEKELGRSPEVGESVQVDQFELVVEQAPLIGPKIISVRTIY